MATPSVLDFDELLRPISSEWPSGASSRSDAVLANEMQKIKSARDSAVEAERLIRNGVDQMQEVDKSLPPDWRSVCELAREALITLSKDLSIVAWLIEALVREDGFAGLRDGLRLACQIYEMYWSEIGSPTADSGTETKKVLLKFLDDDSPESLISAIGAIPITFGDPARVLFTTDYKAKMDTQPSVDRLDHKRHFKNPMVNPNLLVESVDAISYDLLENLSDDINECLSELEHFSRALSTTITGQQLESMPVPQFSHLHGAIEEYLDVVKSLQMQTRSVTDDRDVSPKKAARFDRTRPPRVQITYPVATSNGVVERELPFIVGVLGDFSGNAGEKPRLEERHFLPIDRDNFDTVVETIRPTLYFRVDNVLVDDDTQLKIELTFQSMRDFEPGRVIEQVPPLKELLETRGKLSELRSRIEDELNLEKVLGDLLRDEDSPNSLTSESDTKWPESPAEETAEIASEERPATPAFDENVQFTVYRPKVVVPEQWHSMLIFAHLDELPIDASPDAHDPIEIVKRQGEAILGEQLAQYRESREESELAVPREGEITFVPEVPGVEFRPARQSILWLGKVQRQEFELRAGQHLDGQTARGHITVFLGHIILASIPISFRVDRRHPRTSKAAPHERQSVKPYRRVFTSYSHTDATIVKDCERYISTLGDTYLRDVTSLRAGEQWSDRLEELIGAADIFQLFWSNNSMYSPFVEREWRFAMSLNRTNFVRPIYWETPFPNDSDRNLPPPELSSLHFHYLGLDHNQRKFEGEDNALGSPPSTAIDGDRTISSMQRRRSRGRPSDSSQDILPRNRSSHAHIQYETTKGYPAQQRDTESFDTSLRANEVGSEASASSLLTQMIEATKETPSNTDEPIEEILRCILSDSVSIDESVTRTLDQTVNRIDEVLSCQLSAILHAPEFTELEGTWRGLHYLVTNTKTSSQLKISVLDCNKDEFSRDFKKSVAFDQSNLFKKVYKNGFRESGGEPYGVLIGDFAFDNSPHDVHLLSGIAKVAAAAFCPFISAASPRLACLTSWRELAQLGTLQKESLGPEYAYWQSFRDSENSRFVVLTMPRVLARLPYGNTNNLIEEFAFEEIELDKEGKPNVIDDNEFCWMNAAFVLGTRMTDAFTKYGWGNAIRGIEGGGLVENLLAPIIESADEVVDLKCPMEITIDDRREYELAKLGFLPLCHIKNTDKAVFITANTTHRPKNYASANISANTHLAARLPDILNMSRFAHYLMIIARDKTGKFISRSDMEQWLNQWLAQYIMPDKEIDSHELRAKFLLAKARVELHDIHSEPGCYKAAFNLQPYLQLEGLSSSLTLEIELPTAGGKYVESSERREQDDSTAVRTEQIPVPYYDENVQFTVYRTKVVTPEQWHPMLVFAHLDDLPIDAPLGAPHPLEEVKNQATAILGNQLPAFRHSSQEAEIGVLREGEITFVPWVRGVKFYPSRQTILWLGNVEHVEFKLLVGRDLDGQTARGSLTVFLGNILIATIPLSIRIDRSQSFDNSNSQVARLTACPYRKIFASYSHQDTAIVQEFERLVPALGDRYLRDAISLRAGEQWGDRLEELIKEADVFQLFWSKKSMYSKFVEREWRHALSLQRPDFVRPTYWEDPLPSDVEQHLPPPELRKLHFHRIGSGAVTGDHIAQEIRPPDPQDDFDMGSTRTQLDTCPGSTNTAPDASTSWRQKGPTVEQLSTRTTNRFVLFAGITLFILIILILIAIL